MQLVEKKPSLTLQIIVAMVGGTLLGILLHWLKLPAGPHDFIFNTLDAGGKIFINLLKMLVVPIVFISLVTGTCNLGDGKTFGRLAIKTLLLYLVTTALAISLALGIASMLPIGQSIDLIPETAFSPDSIPSLQEIFINMFPSNPVKAMASGNMLQIIVFAILFGLSIAFIGEKGTKIIRLFNDLNAVVMKLIHMIINLAPYGVFCLVSALFTRLGADAISQLLGYFLTVLLVLMVHLLVSYPILLRLLAKLNPIPFFIKLFPAMLFAFSTSSSNASIPVVLTTVEEKLGVKNSIASFVVPLGATINMDGTAIMQGVATVFIANSYNIDIGLTGYLMVVLTATLASIGTAGIPSVGLITLTMVLQQVGLPVEGIALIIGVDRLLDMTRTAVNITGDATVSCVIAKSEKALDLELYNKRHVVTVD